MGPRTRTGTIVATPTHKRVARLPAPSTIKAKTKSRLNDNENNGSKDTVGVYLRLRPLGLDEPTLTKVDEQQVKAFPPDGSNAQLYSFTKVFDNAPQSEIFDKVARPVVEDFITAGKDGLIFTYGITGSGKTYTMEGLKTDPGLIYRTIDFLFNSIGSQQTMKGLIGNDGQNNYVVSEHEQQLYPILGRSETPSAAIPSVIKWQNRAKETTSVKPEFMNPTVYYCLFISLIELYNKQVHDLFEDFDNNVIDKDKKKREIRTDQAGRSYVANAVEIEVKSADEAVELYTRGIKRRKTGSTALNQESSRGHCVLNLKLVQVRKNYDDQFDEATLISSQLCLVDLAGSERAKRSGATGGALHEACNINNSLGALRKCIRALRDREPTSNIQYRDYSLTRLFKSYFEGNGSVCMVLCVKPTAQDFHENNIAMEFGLLTQDVAIDYASPPKQLKRSKSRVQDLTNYEAMNEFFEKKLSYHDPNPELDDEKFIENWIDRMKSNRDKRKKYIEIALSAQNEVRQNIVTTMKENASLKHLYETRTKDLRGREEQMEMLKSKLGSTERSRDGKNEKIESLERAVRHLEKENNDKKRQIQELHLTKSRLHDLSLRQAQNEKLWRDIVSLMKTEEDRNDNLRRINNLLRKMEPREWATGTAPSAPEMEPIHSSSPMGVPNPSTSETTDSNTPLTTSNSSSEAMDYQEHAMRSPVKTLLSSPNAGVPVVNPRHNRSLSCSSMQWIHHRPSGTVDTGTVMKPKFRNGRSVRNLRSSDILQKGAAGYSVVHQDADMNGEVETSVYKGQILATVCGGAQVILNDIETMRQASPKRKRASSDAH